MNARSHALRILSRCDPPSPQSRPRKGHADPQHELESAFAENQVPAALRPAVQNLVLTCGRQLALLDYLLSAFLQDGRLARLPGAVRNGLRLGAGEALFGEAPGYACVSSWVEEVKASAGAKLAAVVNAVLHRIAETGESATDSGEIEAVSASDSPPALVAAARALARGDEDLLRTLATASVKKLALIASHPRWLVRDWRSRFPAEYPRILAASQRPHRQALRLDYRFRGRQLAVPAAESVLELERLAEKIVFADGEYLLAPAGAAGLARSAFNAGLISLQGVASQAVIHAFPPPAEGLVLDACAGVGVKTTQLALLMGGTSRIVACDLSAARLEGLVANFQRLQLSPPRTFVCDLSDLEVAASLRQAFPAGFSRIYIDAPCTGTGTLGRLPFKRWTLRRGDAAKLAQTQLKLLAAGRTLLAPGGDIIYLTCSLQREENADVVAAAVRTLGLAAHGDSWMVLPTENHLEGMFAAQLGGR